MHRTQLLLPRDLHRRAADAARARRMSLGNLVRAALAAYPARAGGGEAPGDALAPLERLRNEGLGFVTSEWVLAEAVTLLKARGAVEQALALGDALRSGRLGYLAESTPERRRRAWELFVRYRD